MRFQVLIIIIITIVAFTSCKSSKREFAKPRRQTKVDSIYSLMVENQFNADWFTGKIKGVYQMPDDKQVFSGQIRLRKDSVIWVSIYAMMNIEVFRIEIQPDSFKFINRLKKTYIHESTKYLKDRFNVDVDFSMIQSLMLGNDFPFYETDVFKLMDNNQGYHLKTLARHKLKQRQGEDPSDSSILVQSIWIDKDNYRITKQNVKVIGSNKTKLRVTYRDFEDFNGQLFPMKRILRFKEDQNTFLEISFTKITLNEKLRFPFRISKKYTKQELKRN